MVPQSHVVLEHLFSLESRQSGFMFLSILKV